MLYSLVKFEWDESKAVENLEKHGVSFEESTEVFADPLYVDFFDPDHSDVEQPYLIIGMSAAGRLLIVSYTERDSAVRVISARELTAAERRAYEED